MIIWLASYPRSGNSLCRRFLHKVFGVYTHSKHNSRALFHDDENKNEMLGYLRWQDASWQDAYKRMNESPDTFFVKTHDAPDDDNKAVYIVRDGRMASVSYRHYLHDLFPEANISLRDIITGFATYGSWGSHLASWDPQHRPNTIWLRYEDLVQSPDECIRKLAGLTGLPTRHEWENDFDALHQFNPGFFRRGKIGPKEDEISTLEQDLFWWLHGQWMIRLGYAAEPPALTTPTEKLAERLCCDIARKSTDFFRTLEEKEAVIRTLSKKPLGRIQKLMMKFARE